MARHAVLLLLLLAACVALLARPAQSADGLRDHYYFLDSACAVGQACTRFNSVGSILRQSCYEIQNASAADPACPDGFEPDTEESHDPNSCFYSDDCDLLVTDSDCPDTHTQVGSTDEGCPLLKHRAYCCLKANQDVCRRELDCVRVEDEELPFRQVVTLAQAGNAPSTSNAAPRDGVGYDLGAAWDLSGPTLRNGYLAARLSDSIYNEIRDLPGYFCGTLAVQLGATQCFLVDDALQESEIEWGVLEFPQVTFVVVRGTEEFEDFITDAASFFGLAEDINGVDGVANGFGDGAWAIYNSVVAKLREIDSASGKPVVVTGHSLGGAVTEITALWLHNDGFNVAGVYTIGAPPPGNDRFATAYNAALGNVTRLYAFSEDGGEVSDQVVKTDFPLGLPHGTTVTKVPACAYISESGELPEDASFPGGSCFACHLSCTIYVNQIYCNLSPEDQAAVPSPGTLDEYCRNWLRYPGGPPFPPAPSPPPPGGGALPGARVAAASALAAALVAVLAAAV